MKELEIYCDGSRDENGVSGIGLVFVSNNVILKQLSYKLPFKGNGSWLSEYTALIYALYMLDTYVESLTVYTDQIGIINQIMGVENEKEDLSKKLLNIIKREIKGAKCKYFRILYVKSHNKNTFHDLADKLAEEGRKNGNFI